MLNFKKTMIAAFVASSVFSLSGCLDSGSDSGSDTTSSNTTNTTTPATPVNLVTDGRTLTLSTAQHNNGVADATSGAFPSSMITNGTLNSTAWTAGWTVNIHGNATNWTKPSDATADGTCPAGTTDVTSNYNFAEELQGIDVCELPATVQANMILTDDNIYVVNAGAATRVGLGNEMGGATATGYTLTIEPGTLVLGGDKDYLLITRNSKIDAQGTAAKPIVFRSTTWATTGEEQRGTWGGLVLQGKGVDFAANADNEVLGEGGVLYYGGTDNTDNSGTLQYVVITGAGDDLDGNGNELNALTLQGVGSGTTLQYIQVDQTLDDGIEYFGGAANISHAVMSDIGDDGFDLDNGWKGSATNMLVWMSDSFTAGGAGESRGIEADGYDPKDANGDKYLDGGAETTSATLSNFTIVGESISDTGMVLRRAVAIDADNFNISGFTADSCMEIRDRGTIEDHAVTDATTGATTWNGTYTRLSFANTVCYGNGNGAKLSMNKDETEHPANILDSAAADAALAQWKLEGGAGITFVAP